MTSHELAQLLLSKPDLPIATYANGHYYASDQRADGLSHGPIKVGLLKHYAGDHVVLGNFRVKRINADNAYVTEMYHGEAPEDHAALRDELFASLSE